jgi:hypothetical protein
LRRMLGVPEVTDEPIGSDTDDLPGYGDVFSIPGDDAIVVSAGVLDDDRRIVRTSSGAIYLADADHMAHRLDEVDDLRPDFADTEPVAWLGSLPVRVCGDVGDVLAIGDRLWRVLPEALPWEHIGVGVPEGIGQDEQDEEEQWENALGE